MTVAEVRLWGRRIGAVSIEDGARAAAFQYDTKFAKSAIEIAPVTMPLSDRVFSFPDLPPETFRGLPGLLADSLPDRFGNALIDEWLARQGRPPSSFDVVERLCYVGTRGMGALEYQPVLGPKAARSKRLDVDRLVELAAEVLQHREQMTGSLGLEDILQVGTSAGGARAKAIIAWHPESNEVRSGQVTAPPGFGYWLLKLDGVAGNRDKELEDPQGYGAIEYAYANMARAAGMDVPESRLLEEHGRRHFMVRRFDRQAGGEKIHMLSLTGLAHYDFNSAGVYAYEQALAIMRRLDLGMDAIEEQFRRMTFNVVARNQDDHVKNIAFLMDRRGRWSLSPAFDVTYSYNPAGAWTSTHQMTLNGKRDGFTREDLRAVAKSSGMKRGRDAAILEEVRAAVSRWAHFAEGAGVAPARWRQIQAVLRLDLPLR